MLKRLLPVLGVAGVLFMLAPQARAMCVYNMMDVAIPVNFECTSSLCRNNWTIQPNDYYCRPGKGGWILPDIGEQRFALRVDAHGYVVFYTILGNEQQACAYASDDSLEQCRTFLWPL